MSAETLAILVSLIAIVVAGYAIYKSYQAGETITGNLVNTALVDATSTAKEIADVALVAVQAAEQLYNDGRITKDERFTRAVNYIRHWYPELDEDVLITNLEAAVMIVNTVVDAMPKKETFNG